MLSRQGGKVNRNGQPRVLVLFPGSVGDFLCVLPAIAALRDLSSEEEIEVVARGEALEIAQQIGWIRQVSSLERGLFAQLFSPLPAAGSEEVSGTVAGVTAVFSWYGHAHAEVRTNLTHLFSQARVQSFAFFAGQADCHASAYYLRCVGVEELRCPSVAVDEEDRQWLERYWECHVWQATSRMLVIHPGSGGQKKRWAPAGFEQVARWWRGRKHGKVLVLLGPAEEQEKERWRRVAEVEKGLSLRQAATLLGRAELYLGNDSGVSHLAGAVGARGVVLFGPTRPQQWRPLGGALSVLQNAPYRAAQPHAPGISLAEISVEEVLAGLAHHVG